MVGWLEFNVPFQHKYGYIRDESGREFGFCISNPSDSDLSHDHS